MKSLKLMMRLSLLGCVITASLGLIQQAQAATGFCTPKNGTNQYNFSFTPVLTDPTQNITGMIIPNASGSNWNLGTTYSMHCDCPNPPKMGPSYITASSPLPKAGILINGKEGYILNDYLAIAAEVYVAGAYPKNYPVPLVNVSNGWPEDAGQPCDYDRYGSGSQGTVDLYFRRPFVGVVSIPKTKLVEVSISSISGVTSPVPASEVYMSGTVTVPQNCDISPSPITIDFGTILSNELKVPGQKQTKFVKNKELTLSCRNISQGVKVDLTFSGTPDPIFNDALKTEGNSDIAVRIEDKSGQVISPSNGRIPVAMSPVDDISSIGHAEINVYPINTSDKPPKVGDFNSTATVKVEIQ